MLAGSRCEPRAGQRLPPGTGGTATGVVAFLNFTFSALLGPVFASRLVAASGGVETIGLEAFRSAFTPFLYGVALAIALALLLRETGTAAAPAVARQEATT